MSALSLYADAVAAVSAYAPAYIAAQDGMVSKYSAIDPRANNAQAQFDALANERAAIVANTTYGRAGWDAAIVATIALKAAAFAEDPTATDQITATLNALVSSRNGVVTTVAASVQSAITANANPEPEAPAGSSTSPVATSSPTAQLTGAADADHATPPSATVAGTATGVANNAPAAFAAQKDPNAANVTPGQQVTQNTTTPNAPSKPGARLQNPLGNFSSYTYQLTLYMISPDAYSAFNESGRKSIRTAGPNGSTGLEAYVVAQSGGVNNTANTRAPGFELDYYIDDLKIKAELSGTATQTASNITEMSFNIYEPYGFSFISHLKKAGDAIKASSKLPNMTDVNNSLRQFFVLGIRFQGYDRDGNVVTGSDIFATDTFNPQSGGVFERFYDICITKMNFKIDGKATVYQVKAAVTAPYIGYGIKKGRLDHSTNIVATTVEEALGGNGKPRSPGVIGLLDKLNADQLNYAKEANQSGSKKVAIANTYSLEFIGPSDSIKNARIVNDNDKSTWPMSLAKTIIESTPAVEVTTIPNATQRSLTFKNDTAIIQAIQIIITNSSYLGDALTVMFNNALEPAPAGTKDGTADADKESNKKPDPVKWYNLSTVVTCLGWDPVVGDYAYNIKYVIQPYDTPATVSAYTGSSTSYYGPHKRYDYWLTGKNSEIINYEQSLDNTYFNALVSASGSDQSQGFGADIPGSVGKQPDAPKLGGLNQRLAAENSYVATLYSPTDFAQAKLTILGDPDYLVQDAEGALSTVYNKFYGTDGFTINANGGQVFIEINFKEAQDYDLTSGLLSINDSILFWKYPKSITKNIKGISYHLLSVRSTFSKGKFTQELDCKINNFPDEPEDSNDPAAREAAIQSDLSVYPENPLAAGAREAAAASDNEAYPPNPVDVLAREKAELSDAEAYPVNPQILESELSVYPPNPVTPASDLAVYPPNLAEVAAAASDLAVYPQNPISVNQAVADDDGSYDKAETARLARLSSASAAAGGREG